MSPQPIKEMFKTPIALATLLVLAIGLVIYFAFTGAITPKEISGPLLSLLGTFVGAILAFKLNEQKEHSKIAIEQKQSINRTLMVLVRQINAIKSLMTETSKYDQEIPRAFNMPAITPPAYADLICDIQGLDFMLFHGFSDLLLRISIEQEGFHQVMTGLRLRNQYYVEHVQPAIAALGLSGKLTTTKTLKDGLGELVFNSALNYSNTFHKINTDSLQGLLGIHAELARAAKAIFPYDKFVQLIPDA